MTSIEKPKELRCPLCLKNGTCDKVAFRLDICGLAKLLKEIEAK